MDNPNDNKEIESEKWDFDDYAFTIAWVLFAALPIIGILIGSLQAATLEDISDLNTGILSIHRWWPFSWIFFMVAWSACTINDAVNIKFGEEGDLEDTAEYALYISITTIMLLVGIVRGNMYSSWLAGPIVFVLFAVMRPTLRGVQNEKRSSFHVLVFIILIVGIIMEIVMGGWIAFPISWIIISAVKIYKTIRTCKLTEDILVDIIYNALSIILLVISLTLGSWIISWLAYPASVIIGKVIDRIKMKKYNKKRTPC